MWLLRRLIHLFFGHPTKDCVDTGNNSVRCKCGPGDWAVGFLPVMDTGTLPTMSKAELSRAQFRSLFFLHEPKLLAFSDSMLEAFGRGSIAKVTIYCKVELK